MDLVTIVLLGIVLVFICLGLYELFRKPRQGDVAETKADFSNTELVADDLPPSQTGLYKVRHMLASTEKPGKKDARGPGKPGENLQPKFPPVEEESEEELPDPFA